MPKVVLQHHLEQDLNLRPVDRKPKCLARCTTVPPNCRVCGTVSMSCMCHFSGAHVTLTDRPVALPVLRKNIECNGVQNVEALELNWGQKNLDQFSHPYDVIIGADIVYVEETFEDLLLTIEQLSDDRTIVVLSCHIRYERDLRFLELLRKRFAVQLLHQNRDVKVFTARKL